MLEDIEIRDKIGQGQFGEVYLGLWQKTVSVAMKCLKKKELLNEFLSEASMLDKLQHPNIGLEKKDFFVVECFFLSLFISVRFYGIYKDSNDNPYLITEYCSKGSLKILLVEENTSLSQKTLLQMCRVREKKINTPNNPFSQFCFLKNRIVPLECAIWSLKKLSTVTWLPEIYLSNQKNNVM